MKKIYALFICLILMIAVATAAVIEMPVAPAIAHISIPVIGAGVPSGGACDSEIYSETADYAVSPSNHVGYTAIYIASKFVATETTDICSAITFWQVTGSPPDQDIVYEIWSHDAGGDEPDAQIGSSSDSVNAQDIVDNAERELTFSGTKPSIVNTTTYWFVVEASNTDGNFSNNVQVNLCNATPERIERGTDAATWTNIDTSKALYLKLNKES